MPHKKMFMFLSIILISSLLQAQIPGEKVSIGTKEILHSKILNEDRNVYILCPEGYSRSSTKYPVLYMLYNTPSEFHHSTGIVSRLARLRLIPRMISVAVDLGDGRRDLTPTKSDDYGPTSGGAENFLRFFKDELVPFVEKNYRTGAQRLYWSHSIGGLFGLYAFLKEPGVFNNVLVSSPWMVYDRDEKYILKSAEKFLEQRSGQKGFLYICTGNEPNLIPEIDAFLKILEEMKPENLTWEYEKMPDENHETLLVRSLTECLRAYGRQR